MIEVKDVSMRFRMANDRINSIKEYAIGSGDTPSMMQMRTKVMYWYIGFMWYSVRKRAGMMLSG